MRLRGTLTLFLLVLALALLAAGCSDSPKSRQAAVATSAAVTDTRPTTAGAVEQAGPAPLFYGAGSRDVAIEPRLSAKSYIAVDADTGEILVARRERQRRPIASLTKIMTALLVIDAGDLGKKARVPDEAINVEPNREGLKKGRWYPRKLLLYSALMVSANDSAATLAYDTGGGSVNRFYRMMNAKARELGMTDTTYRSASGLNDDSNLSSARDQVVVTRAALQLPLFRTIVGTHRRLVDWPPPTYKKEWVNHNKMLVTYAGTYGVKTGYTSKAGGCLVVAVRRDGHSVIAVILGSRNVWADMPRLADAAFARIGV